MARFSRCDNLTRDSLGVAQAVQGQRQACGHRLAGFGRFCHVCDSILSTQNSLLIRGFGSRWQSVALGGSPCHAVNMLFAVSRRGRNLARPERSFRHANWHRLAHCANLVADSLFPYLIYQIDVPLLFQSKTRPAVGTKWHDFRDVPTIWSDFRLTAWATPHRPAFAQSLTSSQVGRSWQPFCWTAFPGRLCRAGFRPFGAGHQIWESFGRGLRLSTHCSLC
jgi:hypothetical protein